MAKDSGEGERAALVGGCTLRMYSKKPVIAASEGLGESLVHCLSSSVVE